MEEIQMRAQVEVEPGVWEPRHVPCPVPGDDQLLLKTRVCAVGVSEENPGRGFFGVVEAIGSGVSGFEIGDRVAACVIEGHCFADYVAVPADDCCCLSEELDDYTSAFVAPLAHVLRTAELHAVPLAKPCIVEGAHVLQTALACARGLAPVISVVHSENEKTAVRKIGADYAIYAEACGDPKKEIEKILDGRQAAVVIRGDELAKNTDAPWPWEDAITLLTYRRIDPKPLYSVAVPMEDLQSAMNELHAADGPVNIFINTALKSRFTFPGYREPMSATIKP